jgi:uncharacterized protein
MDFLVSDAFQPEPGNDVEEWCSGELDRGKLTQTVRNAGSKSVNRLVNHPPLGWLLKLIATLAVMGFDQYHEPASELSQETRTRARIIASLTEEAEAIGWYDQRISVEKDAEARAIMQNAQQEEFKHFGMDLEFLLRRMPKWQKELKLILFKAGDIVEHGEEAEKSVD